MTIGQTSSICSRWQRPFDAIRNPLKPTVRAVNGMAEGGGLMFALMSTSPLHPNVQFFGRPKFSGNSRP
jgi:hypothetical protein